jgi:hypothetical protein
MPVQVAPSRAGHRLPDGLIGSPLEYLLVRLAWPGYSHFHVPHIH